APRQDRRARDSFPRDRPGPRRPRRARRGVAKPEARSLKPDILCDPMAARPTWKGYLKVSLVNIPIKVFPATESSATISFNQLHGECNNRINQKKWCSHCAREVPNSEIVKGYEYEKGRYVVLSEEDFENVRTESTRVIDLVQFADESSIDPMYVDRTYYLAPDGGVATDAFAVMREGM